MINGTSNQEALLRQIWASVMDLTSAMARKRIVELTLAPFVPQTTVSMDLAFEFHRQHPGNGLSWKAGTEADMRGVSKPARQHLRTEPCTQQAAVTARFELVERACEKSK